MVPVLEKFGWVQLVIVSMDWKWLPISSIPYVACPPHFGRAWDASWLCVGPASWPLTRSLRLLAPLASASGYVRKRRFLSNSTTVCFTSRGPKGGQAPTEAHLKEIVGRTGSGCAFLYWLSRRRRGVARLRCLGAPTPSLLRGWVVGKPTNCYVSPHTPTGNGRSHCWGPLVQPLD